MLMRLPLLLPLLLPFIRLALRPPPTARCANEKAPVLPAQEPRSVLVSMSRLVISMLPMKRARSARRGLTRTGAIGRVIGGADHPRGAAGGRGGEWKAYSGPTNPTKCPHCKKYGRHGGAHTEGYGKKTHAECFFNKDFKGERPEYVKRIMAKVDAERK